MEKHKNVYIGAFTIVVICVACFAIYLGAEIKNLKNELKDSKASNDLVSTEASTYADQSSTVSNNVQIKEVEKIVEKGVFVPFDTNKKKFETDLTYEVIKKSVLGCNIKLDNSGKVYLNIDRDAKENFPKTTAPVNTNLEITGFSKKVVDVFIGEYGNGYSYPVILFLMADGTVEYLNSKYAFENNVFVSEGKISGVENIVRIEQAGAYNGGGISTVIAIDKDGYYYDVASKVSK
jgi:hypothetical protein